MKGLSDFPSDINDIPSDTKDFKADVEASNDSVSAEVLDLQRNLVVNALQKMDFESLTKEQKMNLFKSLVGVEGKIDEILKENNASKTPPQELLDDGSDDLLDGDEDIVEK